MAETILETTRLRLRTWDGGDVAPFMAALNDDAVMQWLGGRASAAQCQSMYERMCACQAAHGYCFWLMERQSDAQLLGFCGLYVTNRPDSPVDGRVEIGWRLRADGWGQGYAREAAEASLTYGFGTIGLTQILAYTVKQNAASWGLMQRLGMVRARAFDHRLDGYGDDVADQIVYRIDRGDWMV